MGREATVRRKNSVANAMQCNANNAQSFIESTLTTLAPPVLPALGVLHPEDGRRNGVDNSLANLWVTAELEYVLFVLLAESAGAHEVLLLQDVVCDYVRGEDGEASLLAHAKVVAVRKYTSNLYAFSRPGLVNKVVKKDDVLAPRDPTGRNLARHFLESDPLVVLVDRLGAVELEGSVGMAVCTSGGLEVAIVVHAERAQNVPAPYAVVLGELQLRLDASSAGYDTADLDEGVEVHLPEVPETVRDGEVGDADEDLVLDVPVLGEKLEGEPAMSEANRGKG